MKKIKNILLSFLCLSLINMTPVLAENPPKDTNNDPMPMSSSFGYDPYFNDVITQPIDTDLVSQYLKIDAENQTRALSEPNDMSTYAYVTNQAWAVEGMVHYFQDDSRWANIQLNGCSAGNTFASAGYAVTAFSMIMTYNYRSYDTPPVTNTKLGSYACPFNYSGAASKYGVTSHPLATTPQNEATAKSIIRGALSEGQPVLVGMRKVNSTSTHFVTVYGYEQYSDGGLFHYIYDPEGNNNYGTLEDYMANWYIQRIFTFY